MRRKFSKSPLNVSIESSSITSDESRVALEDYKIDSWGYYFDALRDDFPDVTSDSDDVYGEQYTVIYLTGDFENPSHMISENAANDLLTQCFHNNLSAQQAGEKLFDLEEDSIFPEWDEDEYY